MNILFLDAYFYPENIAFSHLERDIIDGLIARGHSVSVISPTPSRGLSDNEIKRYKKIKHETHDGVEIQRFSAPREGRNPLTRAVRYIWCNFRQYSIAKRRKDADVIFAVSTPPTQGRMAGRAAKKLGVPFVYSIQDLFPDSLVTSGLASENSVTFRFGERMEKKTYRSASEIITLSETMRDKVVSRGVDADKVISVSNWIDTDAVAPVSKADNPLFEEFGIDRNSFIVVYAGNFGASQGADIILRAADMLKENRDISFVIFGGGTEFDSAKALAKELELGNVLMFDLLPVERTAQVYSLGDVALITCKKGVGNSAVPSKLWSIMACDTPIIASFDTDSELAQILDESGAGICVEPESAEALAKAIEDISEGALILAEKNAREYAVEHASKEISVQQYIKCIESAT